MNNKADIVMIRPNDQKAVYGDTYKYIACEPPYWMALAGNAVACLCVQKRGGIPAIPKKREVMEFLNQHIKK